ncbi:hypothetical protein [Agromyces laixinhei]|uniref:hypothetical protein n=1 Tax=Agromyces laixinhei TaxID=2585717 RepID=UPI0011165B89|nr:hypothetical protein [Agromyces laixinhei]
MGRTSAFRIVRWERKLLYIAVAWMVAIAIADLSRALGATEVAYELVNTLVNLAAFAFAVRVFRGQGEPVDPPRAWWRMTAWPALSRRLGILFAVLAAMGVLGLALPAAGVGQLPRAASVALVIGGSVQMALLATLYLNSAVRMARLGIAKPERFRSSIRLT